MEFFYLQLTTLAFLLTVGAFLLAALASLLTVGVFFAYSGRVHLIRALRDCKQRSLTVSKKTPTVSKKVSPLFISRDACRDSCWRKLFRTCFCGVSLRSGQDLYS